MRPNGGYYTIFTFVKQWFSPSVSTLNDTLFYGIVCAEMFIKKRGCLMYSRFFYFFLTAASFHSQAVAEESAWERVDKYSWILQINGAGREETIVLVVDGTKVYFAASAPCPNDTYGQTYWWADGETLARGLNCKNKKVVRSVKKHWGNWINPLPDEVIQIKKSPYGKGLPM